MSSDLQSALAQLQSNDYGSLVIAIAVSYDYCLTFSKEVTYIWRRPWTWVSTFYLLIRYGGYLTAIVAALIGSTFIPGPAMVGLICTYLLMAHANIANVANHTRRNAVYLLGTWAYPIFWAGADMVMILRVYAMYQCSRVVLAVLVMMYIAQMIILIASSSIYSDPNYVAVSMVQILDVAICNVVFSTQTWNNATTIVQFILAIVMCILVTVQFVRQSLQMYRATQAWQSNKYTNLLAREGLLYFFVTIFYSLVNMLGMLGLIPQGWVTQVLMAAINVPLYTLIPRFVMNVRELYTLDTQGRHDRDIDTGFGLSSSTARGGGSTTMGTMAFAESGGTGELDGEEMGVVGQRVGQVLEEVSAH